MSNFLLNEYEWMNEWMNDYFDDDDDDDGDDCDMKKLKQT